MRSYAALRQVWTVGTDWCSSWSWIEPSNSARPTLALQTAPSNIHHVFQHRPGSGGPCVPRLTSFSDSPGPLDCFFGKSHTGSHSHLHAGNPGWEHSALPLDSERGHISRSWICHSGLSGFYTQFTLTTNGGSYLVVSDLKNFAITLFRQSLFL